MHTQRGWRSIFFPCKLRNKDRKLWKCCYCISWLICICIRTTSFLQTEVLWSGRVVVCFSLRQFQNIVPHSRFCQWFRLELCWSTTSNPCPQWMWYSHQGWYKKQSCQRRSWLLPLTVRIWQGCIESRNDCWCWEVSPKMYNKAWCWHFRWTAFYMSTMTNIWSLTMNTFCQLLITSNSIYFTHVCSVIFGYTLLFWKILTWNHLNMVID